MRKICDVADEIQRVWGPKVNYAAKPYLEAMRYVAVPDDKYLMSDGRSLTIRFLANASTFRGEEARRLKAELKAILK